MQDSVARAHISPGISAACLRRPLLGNMISMHPQTQGRFNAAALYFALDEERRARRMTWTQVANEVGVSVATLTRTRLGGRMEVDGMLAMVRWLGRTAESFTFGYVPPMGDARDRR